LVESSFLSLPKVYVSPAHGLLLGLNQAVGPLMGDPQPPADFR
jgi:hypothetical protein